MHLTKKQKQILDYLNEYIQRFGLSPTYEEIAEHFGYRSKGTVHKHITNLEDQGYIKKDWNRSRAVELIRHENGNGHFHLPLKGRVAAGQPIEAIEEDELIEVPGNMIGNGDHYVLQVRGNSMIEENIQNGDFVIIKSSETAENGEMVVALIGGEEATLKKFYREGNTVQLVPANESMAPIRVSAGNVRIRGTVIGVMRKY